jgi:tetratricopeptide (TPR) repeat protein
MACREQPDNPAAWAARASVQIASGDIAAVAGSYRRLLELQPGNCVACFNLAIACSRLNRPREAMAYLQKVVALDPHHTDAIVVLAEYHKSVRNYPEAIRLLTVGAADNPDDVRVNWLLGLCLQDTGELEPAAVYFSKACHLMRSCGKQPRDFYPTRDPQPGDTFRYTSAHKLLHDSEQFEYLLDKGLLPATFAADIAAYRDLLAAYEQARGPMGIAPLSPAATASIGGTYNRLVHESTRGHDVVNPLNRAVDWQAVVADYRRNAPGITWVDDLLEAEALQELYAYCLESTVWYDFRHDGYLGAYADDGFDSPLLFRIAAGLRAAMPELLRDHPVRFIWAYRYDQRLHGIGTHADAAAVNVNFWITPDTANLDPETGGLVVYKTEAPPDWDFAKYNNDREAIHRFLETENAASLRIPYRRNRAVIFNSDLFHETDDLHFRDGFENRRINITMLFGDRAGKN